MKTVGLRIDIDTHRGTRQGVPALRQILKKNQIKASFFFSVGPDNMGRHIWRLLNPTFLKKMLRSNAPSLYGWEILFRGTFWPGPIIGKNCAQIIRDIESDQHEIGLHAWDHHAWQIKAEHASAQQIHQHLEKGFNQLSAICKNSPTCSAAPAWKCTPEILLEKEKFPFKYNSDCRGRTPFLPIVNNQPLKQPQIPTTLPTYDEVIGQNGLTDATYNQFLIKQIQQGDSVQSLTIHAEVEGICKRDLFKKFIQQAHQQNIRFVPLSELFPIIGKLPHGTLQLTTIPGRHGTVAIQAE